MDRPHAEIEGCRLAHQRLGSVLADVGDTDIRQPSNLPGWSVGHVLSEVEVHVVDLGLGVGPADWSDDLVSRALPRLIAGVSDRADQRELMAWLLGRGPAPELKAWG